MKRFGLSIMTVTLSLATACLPLVEEHLPRWEQLPTEGLPSGKLPDISLRVDRHGVPHLAVVTDSQRPSVYRYSDGRWISLDPPQLDQYIASGVTLEFDANNTPCLGFIHWTTNFRGTVLVFSNSGWTNLGVVGFTPPHLSFLDMAYGNGALHVLFDDSDHEEKASVMRFSNGAWSSLGASGFSQYRAYYPRLCFSQSGRPYAVYNEFATLGKITARQFLDGAWRVLGYPQVTSTDVSSFAFDVDGRETAYLAYAVSNTGQAAVLCHDQEGWRSAGNRVIGGGATPGLPATEVSLVVDMDGNPLLALVDRSRENRISVFSLAGDSWQPLDFPGISPPEARAPQLQTSPQAVTVSYLTGPEHATTIGIARLPRRIPATSAHP